MFLKKFFTAKIIKNFKNKIIEEKWVSVQRTRDIPTNLVFTRTGRYIASALYCRMKRKVEIGKIRSDVSFE